MRMSPKKPHPLVLARSLLIAVLVSQLSCAPVGAPATTAGRESAGATFGKHRAALNPPSLEGYRTPVGAIPTVQYRATTTDDGASQITIPIWTPPGRHGVQPNLAIKYNSGGGRGLFGLGTALTGLSEVARCWRTLAQDGELSKTSVPDEFCLDGVRLVRNASNPREFRPEGNPGVKVTSAGGTPTSPTSFEARTKDGLIMSYGDRDSSSHSQVMTAVPNLLLGGGDLSSVQPGSTEVRSWKQDALKDRWGNSMEIDYQRSSSALGRVEVRPIEIRYTKSSALSPSRRVKFHYKQATQPTASTSGLITVEATAVVARVTVEAELRLSSDATGPMQFFREYRLGYSQTPTGKRIEDRLASVTECYGPSPDTTSLSCGEALAFDWTDPGDEVPTFTRRTVATTTASSHHTLRVAMELTDSAVGDFDGDGFDDYLLRRPVLNQFVPVHVTPSAGTVAFNAEWVLSRGSVNGLTAPILVSPGLPGSASSSPTLSARVIDLNRDGQQELVLLTSGSPVVQATDDGLTYVSGATYDAFSFNPSTNQFMPMGIGEPMVMPFATGFPVRSFALMMGDVTGDLVPDVVRDIGTTCGSGTSCPDRTSGLVVRTGTGSMFSTSSALVGSAGAPPSPVVIASGQEQFIFDVDGNGGAEVLIRERSPGAPDSLSTTLRAFSVNQPLSIETKLHAELMERSATAAAAFGKGCVGPAVARGLVRYFADVDGDGLSDSVAVPSHEKDTCKEVRDWTGLMFVSRNIGGQFLPAVPDTAPSGAVIGPTLLASLGGGVEIGSEIVRPSDWGGPYKSVDNGVRFADLNRDGRADLILAGDYLNALGTVLQRPTAVVRFGTPQGTFGSPRPVADISFTSNGYFDYQAPTLVQTTVAGRGPRDRRFGDFNGDGSIDFVQLVGAAVGATGLSFSIVEDASQTGPDSIAVVHGVGSQTAVPRTEFGYQFAGPAAPADFFQPGPQNCAQAELSCRRKAGWLVREQRTEANGFEQPQASMITYRHSYSLSRVELNGRGRLGFERHFVVNTSLGTDRDRTTNWSRLDLGGGRYTYQATTTVRETAPVQAGMRHSVSTSSGTQIPDSNCAFRLSERVVSSETTEGGVLVSRATTTTALDSFGNETDVTTTLTDGVRTEVRKNRLVGVNAADTTEWLVTRYPVSEVTSTVGPDTTTRTTDFTYLPGKVEAEVVTVAKNEPLETATTTGLTLRRTVAYDAFGNAVGVTEASDSRAGAMQYPSRVTSVAMDARDAIVAVSSTNAEGHVSKKYFEVGSGMLVATDDENDVRDAFSYDRFLRIVESRAGLGEVVQMRFANSGLRSRLRTTTVDSDVNGLGYVEHDPLGRTVRTGSPSYQLGTVVQDTVYDLNSRPTAVSLRYRPGQTPLFVERDYDSIGRIISEHRPGETATTPRFSRWWEYSARRVDARSERNVQSRAEFDFAGREVLNSTQVDGRYVATTQTYGPFGLLKSVSHPPLNWAMSPPPAQANLTTSFVYDVSGRILEVHDPDSGTEARLYTPFGESKRTVDANGGVTTREYDRLGRPTLVLTVAAAPYLAPAGASSNDAQRTTFQWDTAVNGKGRLKEATSVDGITTTFGYDVLGRTTSEQVSISGEGTFSFVTLFDSKSRVQTEFMPAEAVGGAVVKLDRTYSALNGNMESITDATDSTNQELLWALVARNAAGQVTEEQYGPNATGSVLSRIFDPSYHLRLQQSRAASTNTVFQRLSYQWGADELLTRKSDLLIGLEETYSHDELGRLSDWTVRQNCRSSRWEYRYDDWGNLRTRKLDGVTQVENRYTRPGELTIPHAVKQMVEGAVTQDYSYLPAGQLASGGGNTLSWRPFGLPSTVSSTGGTSSYRYDAFGNRVVEVSQTQAGLSKLFTFGPRYEKSVSPSGGVLHGYGIVTDDGQVGQIRRATNSGGVLLSRQVQYFHRDHLGSPDVLSSNAQVLDRMKYEPFGDRRHHWAVGQAVAASHLVNGSFGFTGHRPDQPHRLINMRGRIYDPRTTRFTSPDPVARMDSEGLNRFSYVSNSPVLKLDPTGYFSVSAALGNALLGPSGSEPTTPNRDDSAGPVYETRVVASRTSDASSGDGIPLDPVVRLASDLAQAYANYSGPLDVFENAARIVVGKINPNDWARLIDRIQSLRAFEAMQYFIRLRQAVASGADQALFRAAREGTLSVGKLWSDLFFVQAMATLGVAVVGSRVAANGGVRLFSNQMASHLAVEQAAASRVGAPIVEAGGPGFAELVNQGTVKFVVTESGRLVVGPHTFKGVEISHAVLSGGQPVLAAGQAEIAGVGGQTIGLAISNHSGHFMPSAQSLDVAKAAFAEIGVVFK